MAKFVELDDRGVGTWEDSYEGKLQVHYRQDVEPILELNNRERLDGATDYGIKQDLWHYARIPPVVILEMRFKHGIDIFKRDHMKRAMELINREYPYCKTTEKNHWLKN